MTQLLEVVFAKEAFRDKWTAAFSRRGSVLAAAYLLGLAKVKARFTTYSLCIFILVLVNKCRASYRSGKCTVTELHP